MLCGFLLFLLETGHFEYYDVVILEIRFSPIPGALLLLLIEGDHCPRSDFFQSVRDDGIPCCVWSLKSWFH